VRAERHRPAGLVLTGGRSSRMGRDKARLVLEGQPLGSRLGELLASLASPVLEVGPGFTHLEAVREEPALTGPLGGLVAGWRALGWRGHTGSVLVLACDLPLLEAPAVSLLADWPTAGSVVPVVGGHRQLLCARWSPGDLERASAAYEHGERSLRGVPLGEDLVELDERSWSSVATADSFADCDTPDDLARLERAGRAVQP